MLTDCTYGLYLLNMLTVCTHILTVDNEWYILPTEAREGKTFRNPRKSLTFPSLGWKNIILLNIEYLT